MTDKFGKPEIEFFSADPDYKRVKTLTLSEAEKEFEEWWYSKYRHSTYNINDEKWSHIHDGAKETYLQALRVRGLIKE